DDFRDCVQPLIVQSNRLLQLFLLGRSHFFFWNYPVATELGQSIVSQAPSRLQIAGRDQLFLWMSSQPVFAVSEQLLDLVVTDPVVLLLVENWNQNVYMPE